MCIPPLIFLLRLIHLHCWSKRWICVRAGFRCRSIPRLWQELELEWRLAVVRKKYNCSLKVTNKCLSEVSNSDVRQPRQRGSPFFCVLILTDTRVHLLTHWCPYPFNESCGLKYSQIWRNPRHWMGGVKFILLPYPYYPDKTWNNRVHYYLFHRSPNCETIAHIVYWYA